MNHYKLLTPGPLTTTDTVKQEMLFDHCTWDDDYKKITQEIRAKLLTLAGVSDKDYTVVLMQGSGTFGVESVLTSVIGREDKLLIASNGAYGERMGDIAEHASISRLIYKQDYDKVPDPEVIGMPVGELGVDFLISSANKCIQGVPGFSFIIANREKLMESQGKARSLSLDLYDQWETMEKDGKWRFTSPTHVVLAFARALEEMEAEGGIEARNRRYTDNNRLLIRRMKEMGISPYIGEEYQGPIITTFFYPENHSFTFSEMYEYIKERGYAIYPGKVTEAETFRIGNIGEIYEEDINKLCDILGEFLQTKEKRAV